MANIQRNPNGPLIYAELFEANDVLFWDKTRIPDIEPRDDDVPYVVKIDERVDNLAFRQLGDPALWPIILHRNGLCLPPNHLVPGFVIYIPTLASLTERGII